MRSIVITLLLLLSVKGKGQEKFQVFFDFNKDVPNDQSAAAINNWMAQNQSAEIIEVIGYCDSVDKRDYNKDLAMRRINSILDLLRKSNIKISDNVALKALGKDFKLSKNQSENRKVEILYAMPKETKPASLKDVEDEVAFTNLATLVEEEKSGLVLKFKKAKKGELVRISNINFYFNSEKMMEQSRPLLDELLQIMLDNPKLRIEIHGHICCNPDPMDTKLSYRRAIVIFKYLSKQGIPTDRLAYKGFGSNDPIYRVPESNEKERAANRRVEILIVDK